MQFVCISAISAEYVQTVWILISQGSVATFLRWVGYCRMGFVANFIRFPRVQKLRKSVKIWQSYREFKGGNFLETRWVTAWIWDPEVYLEKGTKIKSHSRFSNFVENNRIPWHSDIKLGYNFTLNLPELRYDCRWVSMISLCCCDDAACPLCPSSDETRRETFLVPGKINELISNSWNSSDKLCY